jgi:hypothetical protein
LARAVPLRSGRHMPINVHGKSIVFITNTSPTAVG